MTVVAERLVTTREVCAQLRCSRSTVKRLAAAGRLVPLRLAANKTLYRQAEIDVFIADLVDDRADQRATVAGALAFLAERHAEEKRPLCPSCGERRVNRGASQCTWCTQQHEAQLLHKRTWWEKHGNDWRHDRQAEHEQEHADA